MSIEFIKKVGTSARSRGVARAVLSAIAFCADHAGRARPGLAWLSRWTGFARMTVVRSIESCARVGDLAVERRAGRANRYTITVGSEPVSERDQSPVSEGDQSRAPASGLGARPHQSRSETGPVSERDPICQEPSGNPLARVRSRAHARRRATGQTGGTPDPRVRSLIAGFCQHHLKALGQPYLVTGGRDGAALKRALGTWDAPAIEATLAAYFSDAWVCEHSPTIAKWVGQLPSLLFRRARAASRGFVG